MNALKKLFKILGPGFVTGASDDDPSGIATYSQTGAAFGLTQAWTALFSFPFMSVVQEMCGRIGLVSGKGLAGVIRDNYSKPVLIFSISLLVIANTINIGADLGAMAASAKMIINLPFIFWLVVISGITLFLEIFVSYKTYSKYLKWLALSLLAYVLTFFIVKQNWSSVAFSLFVPTITFSQQYLLNIVAILGTTISPYLFFWQEEEEVEEEVVEHKIKDFGEGNPKVGKKDIKKMRTDTFIGMGFSNLVMFFIIATTASTLHKNGIFQIETPQAAAQALAPLAGEMAYLLFTIGIIGTGLLAVPVLAGSASYAVSEVFGWKEGLSKKFKQAHGFYGVIALSTLVGLLINFIGIPPIKALYYAAIANGLAAPVLLILILLISNNRKIMGENVNRTPSNILGLAITLVMGVCSLLLVGSVLL